MLRIRCALNSPFWRLISNFLWITLYFGDWRGQVNAQPKSLIRFVRTSPSLFTEEAFEKSCTQKNRIHRLKNSKNEDLRLISVGGKEASVVHHEFSLIDRVDIILLKVLGFLLPPSCYCELYYNYYCPEIHWKCPFINISISLDEDNEKLHDVEFESLDLKIEISDHTTSSSKFNADGIVLYKIVWKRLTIATTRNIVHIVHVIYLTISKTTYS